MRYIISFISLYTLTAAMLMIHHALCNVKGVRLPIATNHDQLYGVPSLEELLKGDVECRPCLYPGGETEALARMSKYLKRTASHTHTNCLHLTYYIQSKFSNKSLHNRLFLDIACYFQSFNINCFPAKKHHRAMIGLERFCL